MFTGIVEELGEVLWLAEGRLCIVADEILSDVGVGDSIAVDGCCLTVASLQPGKGRRTWEADLSPETLRRTTVGGRRAGDVVNLERPVRFADRLGGHLVQGHVDEVGHLLAPAPDLAVGAPAALLSYLVEKGSVTVDGVSLTVVEVRTDSFTVAVVPHTAEVTTLGRKDRGDAVNLEVDVIAKYTERLLAPHLASLDGSDRQEQP